MKIFKKKSPPSTQEIINDLEIALAKAKISNTEWDNVKPTNVWLLEQKIKSAQNLAELEIRLRQLKETTECKSTS